MYIFSLAFNVRNLLYTALSKLNSFCLFFRYFKMRQQIHVHIPEHIFIRVILIRPRLVLSASPKPGERSRATTLMHAITLKLDMQLTKDWIVGLCIRFLMASRDCCKLYITPKYIYILFHSIEGNDTHYDDNNSKF